jgi:TRAP-type C4-dicarboxylate transport system permease small subunit
MEALERAFVALNRWALIVLLAAMACIVFANVTLRYLTNDSLVWAEEVARYLMVWLTFLGAGQVLRFGGHIAIENLHDVLPGRVGIALRGLLVIVLLGFFATMAWQGAMYTSLTRFQTTAATGISFAWVYMAIPIGCTLLAIHLLLIARRYVIERSAMESAEIDAETAASL